MSNLSAISGDLIRTLPHRAFVLGQAEPTRGARKAWFASAVLAFACFMTVVALLAGVWVGRSGTATPIAPESKAPPPAAPTPRWVDINRPLATFDLAGGPYAGLPMHLEAQRWTGGFARRDVLTYGSPQPGEAFVRLLFDRHEPAPAADQTLFVDAARIAGTAGLAVVRSGLTTALPTRFGSFEVADVMIGRSDRTVACLAFRRSGERLTIVGLMCGAGSAPVEPTTLACSLDKIDLVMAGDPALRDLFNAAERQRGLGCNDMRTVRRSADPLRPISSALRGTLGGGLGVDRQLSGLR